VTPGMGPTSTSPISLPTLSQGGPGGANSEHYATGTFTYDPVIETYESGSSPWTATTSGGDRGQRPDPGGRTGSYGNAYLTGDYRQTYQRLCATDVGLVWYTVSDNGRSTSGNTMSPTTWTPDRQAAGGRVLPLLHRLGQRVCLRRLRYASAHDQKVTLHLLPAGRPAGGGRAGA